MPPVTVSYRGIAACKVFMVRYLTAAFKAYEKEAVLFTDGTLKIEFSKTPAVTSIYSWVERDLPAVLIGAVTATYEERTFSKNLMLDTSNDPASDRVYYGGDLNIDMPIHVRATTLLELDNLADTVSILLAGKEAKDYFSFQDIKIVSPPKVSAPHSVAEPDTDYNIYDIEISITLRATWLKWEEVGDRLSDIIVDFDTVFTA